MQQLFEDSIAKDNMVILYNEISIFYFIKLLVILLKVENLIKSANTQLHIVSSLFSEYDF